MAVSRDFELGLFWGDLGLILKLNYFISEFEDEFFLRGEECNAPYVLNWKYCSFSFGFESDLV